MSTISPTRKISRKDRIRQDTVVTFYARALDFFDKNKRLVYGSAVAAIVLLAAIAAWSYRDTRLEARAAEDLAPAVRNYEAGLFREALDGVAGNRGLLYVAETFPSTPTGNLARFYAADALLRLGEHDDALVYFRAYRKSADYIGASALAGEASILEGRGEHAAAARLYEQAARLHTDDEFSPRYMMDAGRAYEAAGDYARALATYASVEREYPNASVSTETAFYVARASARLNKP